MKRTYLRVLPSGNILVQDEGDDGCTVLTEDNVTGVPDTSFENATNRRVLPFYSLTDREEKELLLGRAMTEQYVAAAALEKQLAVVNDLRAQEKAMSEQVEITVVSRVALPESGVGVGFKLTARVEAEKALKPLIEACQKADIKLARAMVAAKGATDDESAKPDNELRGQILPGFGKH